MKKCVSIRKLRCFVRVAMSTKIQESLQKTNEKHNGFWVENRSNFDEKVGCSSVHSKNRENNCRGTPIGGKNQIFCKFGGPRGDPKIVKTGRGFWQKTLENNGPFKNSQFFDVGVTLMGFWLNFSIFGGPQRVPRRSFLAIFPPPHHLPHSLHTSSQNPFKLYTFNPTQPQNEPTAPNPKS